MKETFNTVDALSNRSELGSFELYRHRVGVKTCVECRGRISSFVDNKPARVRLIYAVNPSSGIVWKFGVPFFCIFTHNSLELLQDLTTPLINNIRFVYA